jgi:hypothetical protein
MGRTAYVPGRVKAEDVRKAKEGTPSAHATNAARVYDNLARFYAANEKALIKEEVAVVHQLYLVDYGNGASCFNVLLLSPLFIQIFLSTNILLLFYLL